MRPVRAFAVSCTWWPEHIETVLAHSAGAAKYRLWLRMSDAWSELPFTAMRAKVAGGYSEPRGFRSCVERRGIPFALVGMRVRLDDGREGAIVGHNSSANLDVLFDDGTVLNCHPSWKISYLVDGEWRRGPHDPAPPRLSDAGEGEG